MKRGEDQKRGKGKNKLKEEHGENYGIIRKREGKRKPDQGISTSGKKVTERSPINLLRGKTISNRRERGGKVYPQDWGNKERDPKKLLARAEDPRRNHLQSSAG